MTDEIRYTIGDAHIGRVLVAASTRGVCAVLPGDDDEILVADLRRRFGAATLLRDDAGMRTLVAQVSAMVDGRTDTFAAALDLRGTPFQQQVWHELRRIPDGSTATYTEIAQRIGRPRSVRAVAQACGANPVAVVVPCHRVVARDGAITGYRWGIERKRLLLERESERAGTAWRSESIRS